MPSVTDTAIRQTWCGEPRTSGPDWCSSTCSPGHCGTFMQPVRERYPLQLTVKVADTGYDLPVGYAMPWARVAEGDASPFRVWAVDTDGRLYQFREDEVELSSDILGA